MKKKAITLIALLAVLALMIGAYFLAVKSGGEGQDTVTSAPAQTYTLFSLDVETMTALSYLHDGETLSFSLENNAWRWDADQTLNLDSAYFAAMVSGLQPLTSAVCIAAPDAELLNSFGLSQPSNTVVMTDGTGTHTLYIGNYNSYNGCYYAAMETTDTVYMIPAATAEAFHYAITDLLAFDTLPAITAGKIDSVTLTRGEASRTYTYFGSGNPDCYTDTFKWFAANADDPMTAVSTAAGNSLSSAITALAFSECLSYHAEADAAAYGLDQPARLTVSYRTAVKNTNPETGVETSTDVSQTKTLLIGSIDPVSGCYYATVEGSSMIYLLASPALPELLEPDRALSLPTQIAPVNYNFVNKIAFQTPAERLTVTLSHAGETTYTVSGETVEYSTLSALFSAMQSLSAESNTAESAPDAAESAAPRLQVSFTFSQGEPRQAELVITPYNANFDRVSFLGRDDQLISIRDTEALVKLAEGYQ
ncbi:MAG: DUF4340 domain-containing protein [Clostridia bacterium]|nr:DUF4340 domain-containing protein [Clostridia bacterium]